MIDALGKPQSVLLMGGTSEIGLAIVDRYATSGVRVILAGRPGPRLDEAADRVRARGAEVETLEFDATRPHEHASVIERAAEHGDIDIAVVAYGILGDAERAWTDVEHAIEMAEVNYTGPVATGVALGQRMSRQGHGVIVALSSVAGERVRRSNFVYGSTKAGMDGFYSGLGEAVKPSGVHVLVVRPGFVRTKMTEGMDPAPLSVTADEVADATVAAVKDRTELIWVPKPMRLVMSGLRHVPRPLFRRLPV